MNIDQFIERLDSAPESIEFSDTMSVIEQQYEYTPTAFDNGSQSNAADQNQGSCKLFAFARLNDLDVQQTLACFGQHYRQDVLDKPAANDHVNIRNFMRTGWAGIRFHGTPLRRRTPTDNAVDIGK